MRKSIKDFSFFFALAAVAAVFNAAGDSVLLNDGWKSTIHPDRGETRTETVDLPHNWDDYHEHYGVRSHGQTR